ncbi:DNA polymerase III subunit psi [Stenotrophomonas maltophilia]|uniref:DNA polymerase III subunit psi n=1 Tax=Stenotrophomonas maltophilia TaxID=40324 RepID=UPI00200BC3A2|nr:DNA polymerase III subunit psi [Stenotrophomonas maltophilia]UQA71073.1 DNA polymerase III subunit psi [Stenotrophomonas maltophilia]
MSQDLPVLWSPAQQAWLQAMGYTVYHDGQLAAELDAALQLSVAEAEAAAAPPAEPARAGTAPSSREPRAESAPAARQERPAPRRETPVSAPDTAPAAGRPLPGNARQPVVRLPDRLQIALLRASGCNPNDPATQSLMDSWPLDQLRHDPAAKRALWPQLRALRKRGAP